MQRPCASSEQEGARRTKDLGFAVAGTPPPRRRGARPRSPALLPAMPGSCLRAWARRSHNRFPTSAGARGAAGRAGVAPPGLPRDEAATWPPLGTGRWLPPHMPQQRPPPSSTSAHQQHEHAQDDVADVQAQRQRCLRQPGLAGEQQEGHQAGQRVHARQGRAIAHEHSSPAHLQPSDAASCRGQGGAEPITRGWARSAAASTHGDVVAHPPA